MLLPSCAEIRILADDSIDRAIRVLKILDTIKAERESGVRDAATLPRVAIPGENNDDEDEEYFDEEDDTIEDLGEDSDGEDDGFVDVGERNKLDDIFKSYRQKRQDAEVKGYRAGNQKKKNLSEEEVMPQKYESIPDELLDGFLDDDEPDLFATQKKPWSRKRGSWNRGRK